MSGKFFKIKSALNGLVLEVADCDIAPGARVHTWEDSDGDNQLWYEDQITGTIRSKLNDLCLEVSADGAQMNPYQPEEINQHWAVADTKIVNGDMPDHVFDISASCMDPGADIVNWEDHDGPNQHFDIEYQEPFYFYIKSQMHGKVIDVDDGCPDPGTKVIMYGKKDDLEDNQIFYQDKYGIIHSKLNDFSLDSSDGKFRLNPYDPECPGMQWTYSGGTIRNKLEHEKVADIYDEDTWDGAKIVPFDYSGNSNQLWELEYIL